MVYTTRRRRVPGGWQPLPVVPCADKPKRSLLDEPVPLDQPNMQHRLLRAVGVFYPAQGPTAGARGCPYPLAHLKLQRRPRREAGVFYASKAPAGRPRGTRARGNTVLEGWVVNKLCTGHRLEQSTVRPRCDCVLHRQP